MSTIAGGRRGAAADGTDIGGDSRLRLYRNPLRLLVSAGLWRAVWYLAGYVFAIGWVLFAASFTAAVTGAVFAITLAGIPLLIAAAEVLRWCANVERDRLSKVRSAPVSGGYRPVTGMGLIARAKACWKTRPQPGPRFASLQEAIERRVPHATSWSINARIDFSSMAARATAPPGRGNVLGFAAFCCGSAGSRPAIACATAGGHAAPSSDSALAKNRDTTTARVVVRRLLMRLSSRKLLVKDPLF